MGPPTPKVASPLLGSTHTPFPGSRTLNTAQRGTLLKNLKNSSENVEWPLQDEVYRGFATWCIMSRKWSANTTKAYLTALATAQNIAGLESTTVRPGKLAGWNLEITEKIIFGTQRSINLLVLKIIGYRIATSKWSPCSKQVIRATITTAFFTSARMGELLSPEDLANCTGNTRSNCF